MEGIKEGLSERNRPNGGVGIRSTLGPHVRGD